MTEMLEGITMILEGITSALVRSIIWIVTIVESGTKLWVGEDFMRFVEGSHLRLGAAFVRVCLFGGDAAVGEGGVSQDRRKGWERWDVLGFLDCSGVGVARYTEDFVIILLLGLFKQPLSLR